MKIKVINKSYTEITRHRDLDEQWDGDDTYTSHDIRGIYKLNKNEYCDLDSEFELEKNKNYYLVYGIYSTGNSFCHQDGVIKFVQLYLTKNKAEKCAKALQDHYNLWKEPSWGENHKLNQKLQKEAEKKNRYAQFSQKIELESGIILDYSVDWTGYFEHSLNMHVETVRLI